MPEKPPSEKERDQRLTPIDRGPELLPWRRAKELTECFLYWAPVNSFPAPAAQKQWLSVFLDRFAESVVKKLGLRSEVFLQMKVLYPDLMDTFTLHCPDLMPLVGLLRRPGASLPKAPNQDEIQALVDGRKKYEFGDYMPDLTYWFVKKAEKRYRELFFGHGGMTIIYLKPDPNTVAPKLTISKKMREHPIFQKIDVEGMHEQTFAMTDSFQEKSKELFGKGLESHPTYKGLRFILPLLETADFFKEKEQRQKWFELFDFYFNESPKDKGVLLATKSEIEQELVDIIRRMREEGLRYPER